jgi:hypothetical protein
MQRARDELFASAGFAGDQHGLRRRRDRLDVPEDGGHAAILSDDLGEGRLLMRRLFEDTRLQRHQLGLERAPVECAPQRRAQSTLLDGLHEIVHGTRLHTLDCRHQVVGRRQHDDRNLRMV